jgi:hypothetical protein
VVINNTAQPQRTDVYDAAGKARAVALAAHDLQIIDV